MAQNDIDAARWRAVLPFLDVTIDGDGDGSWVDMRIKDKDTGTDSIELIPAMKTSTAVEFVDRLIANPSHKV